MALAGRGVTGAHGWPVERWLTRPVWLTRVWPLALVLTLALLARWPYLVEWPAFTDESREVLLSLAVAHGESWPWTGFDAYIGPWHTYLLAAFFKLLGPSVWVARGLPMVLNVVAVGLTYWLASRLAGRWAGLIAGGLVAVAPLWVLVNSHIAWAASTTPTYTLGALVAAQRALRAEVSGARGRTRAGWYLLAGLLLGLAAQTHPTALLVSPALALAVIWGRAGLGRLRSPWPWCGLLGGLLGYLPILLYNLLIRPNGSLIEAHAVNYAWGMTLNPAVYLSRAPQMWWNELQTAAGLVMLDATMPWAGWPVLATLLLLASLVLLGAAISWRRGERLLPLALLLPPLLLPLITGYTGDFFAERYLAPQIGLAAVLASLTITRLARTRRWVAPVLGLALLLLPLLSLTSYYQQRVGAPNRLAIETAALLEPTRGCTVVVLDRTLNYYNIGGGGTALRSLRMTLSLAGLRWTTENIHNQTMRDVARDTSSPVVAVLTPGTAARLTAAARLRPISTLGDDAGIAYGIHVYRVPALPICAPPEQPNPTQQDTN